MWYAGGMDAAILLATIHRLRRRGMSISQIAREVGVSKTHVHRLLRSSVPPEWDIPTGPRRRCPDCGALVIWPCRACALRRQLGRMM
ncbi:MAG TPA: helix-turn-helix domain-containing protein [Thermoguttaceae bacterium]|nr:helix-turn-helix domain-containing protein [Thermoguttaceae bacterium]